MTTLQVENLGQVFTPPNVVEFMLSMCQNNGRFLEPSTGEGAFVKALTSRKKDWVGIEIDPRIAPEDVQVQDFFTYPLTEKFDTIIGNPPYVRFQDIPSTTRRRLKSKLFDYRSNLFLFFIEKCVQHLKPGGELIFIVPREFIKLTAAKKLNHWLFEQGSITHFYETGDTRIFGPHTPNCAIFRFEAGRTDRSMDDGRHFTEVAGQLMFLREHYPIRLGDVFSVKVGGVSGADTIFTHPEGNREFVYSRTIHEGDTRRMFYDIKHPHLEAHKQKLLTRKVRTFNENNWWVWGRLPPAGDAPRIYVNGKTRHSQPFFLHDCPHYDGSILGLFPKRQDISRKALIEATFLLNRQVNWQELGFICDGRFLFTQRSLETCLLPESFARFLPEAPL